MRYANVESITLVKSVFVEGHEQHHEGKKNSWKSRWKRGTSKRMVSIPKSLRSHSKFVLLFKVPSTKFCTSKDCSSNHMRPSLPWGSDTRLQHQWLNLSQRLWGIANNPPLNWLLIYGRKVRVRGFKVVELVPPWLLRSKFNLCPTFPVRQTAVRRCD